MKRALAISLLALLSLLGSHSTYGQKLSRESSVSLLTCGSGNDLYSIFGHTAIRVKDTTRGSDIVFNYGTFHFSDDFYVLFVMGKLNYTLSIQEFNRFEQGYRYENRWVDEQVLNLNFDERQDVLDFLMNNYRPENREYLYDFFYDNCSTRPRDVFEQVLKDKLVYNLPQYEADSTFKDLLDVYLGNMQWSDAGMDLGLGMPADKVLTEHEKMYLPDYLLRAFNQAELHRNGTRSPFVKEHNRIVDSIPYPNEFSWYSPSLVFIYVLLIWLILQLSPLRKIIRFMDVLLYFVVGLAGWLIVFLWFITDHTTTQLNFDILWANPFYLPLGFLILVKKPPQWLRRFFLTASILCVIILVSWPFLPQNLNEVYLPMIFLLAWRGYVHSGINFKELKGSIGLG